MTTQHRIPGVGTSDRPSATVLGNLVFAGWKGVIGDLGIYAATFDGGSWGDQWGLSKAQTSYGPWLAELNDRVYFAWRGPDASHAPWVPDQRLSAAHYSDTELISVIVPNVGSEAGPSISASGQQLAMTWKGASSDQGIYWSLSNDGENWRPQARIPGVGTSYHPALGLFRNQLYMAWKGVDDDQGIYWSRFDGAKWVSQTRVPGVGTSTGPALAEFEDRLYMAWKGLAGDQGLYWSRFDGGGWIPQQRVSDVGSSVGSTLVAMGKHLYMIWKGIDGDPGIYWATFDGNSWL